MASLPTIPVSQRSRTWTVTFPVDLKWLVDDPRYAEIRESFENQFSDAFMQRWAIVHPHGRAARGARNVSQPRLIRCS